MSNLIKFSRGQSLKLTVFFIDKKSQKEALDLIESKIDLEKANQVNNFQKKRKKISKMKFQKQIIME